MKTFISILILLVAVGCGKSPEEKIVGGTYAWDKDNDFRLTFKKDGVCEGYELDKPNEEKEIYNWEIKNGEVIMTAQLITSDGKPTYVYRIEKDGDLTLIADGATKDGKYERKDFAMKHFKTYIKLK